MRWFDWFDRGQSGRAGRRRVSRKAVLASAAALALIAGGAAGEAMLRSGGDSRAAAISAGPAPAATPVSFADIVERVKPAVVSVQVRVVNMQGEQLPPAFDPNGPFGDFFRRFGLPQEAIPQEPSVGEAQGSGFFVSPDGYIVTNNHVVQNARAVAVTLDDGRTVDAHVVACDARTDLAVLKTDAGRDYPSVRFASAAPRIGDWVLAVGNPFGLGGTVTAGIVSAHGRDIGAGPYDDFLQIDAPVNRGNSGGPTFNLSGEVVGVNTAIYSPSGGNVGIAFAIPAATAQPIVQTLEHGGAVERGYLGVLLQPLDEDLARSLGLADQHGAMVAQVNSDSPAAHAGLRVGDVILRADGERIDDSRDLARAVAAHRPGARLTLDYMRNGARLRAAAVLATLQDDDADEGKPEVAQGRAPATERLGLSVEPVEDDLIIVAVDAASAAASHGLQSGDVIVEAGGRPCRTIEALDGAVAAARHDHREALLLRIRSSVGSRYVGLPIGRS